MTNLDDTEEFGYNRSSGFTWIIQNEHTFKKMKKTLSTTQVTAFVQKGKLKKVAGIKTTDGVVFAGEFG